MEPNYAKLRVKTRIDGGKSGFGRVFAALRTLALLMILRLLVRSNSLEDVMTIIRQIVYHARVRELWNGTMMELGLGGWDYVIFIIGVLVLLARDFITETGRNCGQILNSAKPVIQFFVMLIALSAIVFIGVYAGATVSADFLYAQY